jgi:hypothetical protein
MIHSNSPAEATCSLTLTDETAIVLAQPQDKGRQHVSAWKKLVVTMMIPLCDIRDGHNDKYEQEQYNSKVPTSSSYFFEKKTTSTTPPYKAAQFLVYGSEHSSALGYSYKKTNLKGGSR